LRRRFVDFFSPFSLYNLKKNKYRKIILKKSLSASIQVPEILTGFPFGQQPEIFYYFSNK